MLNFKELKMLMKNKMWTQIGQLVSIAKKLNYVAKNKAKPFI